MAGIIPPLESHPGHMRFESPQQLEQLHANLGQFLMSGEFIDNYNKAGHGIEKSKMDFFLFNLISSIRRQMADSVLSDGRRISYVWSNLCGMLLCRGNLQLAALETFIQSLQVTDIQPYHVSTLLYAASSVLYIIQTDVLLDTKLSRFEIGLFYLGYLVSKRLLVHLYLGDVNQNEAEMRLSVYMRNFHSSHILYKNLPAMEWLHAYISAVCSTIFKFSKENKLHLTATAKSNTRGHRSSTGSMLFRIYGKRQSVDSHSLSWCVWQALQIWQSIRSEPDASFENYIEQLHAFCRNMKLDNWIDHTLALDIVGEAAKDNFEVLLMLQLLARGSEEINGLAWWPQKVVSCYIQNLVEICRDTKLSSIRRQALLGDRPIEAHPFDVGGSRHYNKHRASTRCGSLADLALFRFDGHVSEEKEELAWKVRHVAYFGLLQLLVGRGDGSSSCDYMKTMCWALILKIKNAEEDERVLIAPGFSEIAMLHVENSKLSDDKNSIRFNSKMASLMVTRRLELFADDAFHEHPDHFGSYLNYGSGKSNSLKTKGSKKSTKGRNTLGASYTKEAGGVAKDFKRTPAPKSEEPEKKKPFRNEILMYTSIRDVRSRMLVQIADYIMRDTNKKWMKEITDEADLLDD